MGYILYERFYLENRDESERIKVQMGDLTMRLKILIYISVFSNLI